MSEKDEKASGSRPEVTCGEGGGSSSANRAGSGFQPRSGVLIQTFCYSELQVRLAVEDLLEGGFTSISIEAGWMPLGAGKRPYNGWNVIGRKAS